VISATVDSEDLERQLEVVRALAPGEMEGVFGPNSLTWRIDREALTFLGAGRALLLQLAHPLVAAAITQHSRTLGDPIGRFHRTFAVVFTMVFGTLDQALSAARGLHRRHATIHGRLPIPVGPFRAGSPYQANDLPALRWVYATLIETAVMTHDFVLPPLTAEERARYYVRGVIRHPSHYAACRLEGVRRLYGNDAGVRCPDGRSCCPRDCRTNLLEAGDLVTAAAMVSRRHGVDAATEAEGGL
jgi:hypothetical protein